MKIKNIILKCSSCLAGLALMITTLNVNHASVLVVHQPKIPAGAKKLRKF